MEYKTSNLITASKERTVSGDGYTVRGYLTRWHEIDLVGDATVPGSFMSSIKSTPNPPLLWSHDYKIPPIGIIKAWREDNTGVFFIASIAATSLGEDIKRLVDIKAVSGVSYGFNVKKDAIKRINGARVRELLEVAVGEVSLTIFPALPSAQLIDDGAKESLAIAELELRQVAGLPISKSLRTAAVRALSSITDRELRQIAKIKMIDKQLAELDMMK